ncbi:MAG: urocanate hydratase [Candidatus Thorarchaeota archaeon]
MRKIVKSLDEVISGKLRIPQEQLLRLDLKPKSIPELPKGEAALHPTTKAGWQTEGIIRAIISNLHNGSNWETLFIYGGSGKAVRSWKAFYDTIDALKNLEKNETLFMQSGVPYGKTLTSPFAPRCVITNSIIVPNWTNYFQQFVEAGLTVYGQMTAGSWIFIGLQGIIQGTYETFMAAIKSAENSEKFKNLSKFEQNLCVSAGLGLMSGAQPLAFKMAKKISIIAEINPKNLNRMYNEGRDRGTPYLDMKTESIDQAFQWARESLERKELVSIGILCNAVDLLEYLINNNITPALLTDQTSAHDMLNGYVPANMSYQEALKIRETDPDKYIQLAKKTSVAHVKKMVLLQTRGSETFDYGNGLRAEAFQNGYSDAFNFQGFVVKYIRSLFCQGKGPFRWAALSNDPEDIRITDKYAKQLFYDDPMLVNWINLADKFIPFEKGLPARVFWAGFFGRAAFGMLLNKLYADNIIKAPVIIGRDHLDGGSVASPYRETEGMIDGSDAIGDFPVLNLLGNALSGATWVSYHGGGGVGIGRSLHAGQVIVSDGTPLAQEKTFRVLLWDPLSAILRHVSAGYPEALEIANKWKIFIPGRSKNNNFDYNDLYSKTIDFIKERTEIDLFPQMDHYDMNLMN